MEAPSFDEWDLNDESGQRLSFNLALSSRFLKSYLPPDDTLIEREEQKEEAPRTGKRQEGMYAYQEADADADVDADASKPSQGMYGYVEGDIESACPSEGLFDNNNNNYAATLDLDIPMVDNNYAPFGDDVVLRDGAPNTLGRISQIRKQEQFDESPRDWTGEWCQILGVRAPTALDKLAKLARLKALAAEFEKAAVSIVKTIVDERNLFFKTIKPIQAGGVAGGIKYLHRNIFLKFTLDQMGLYSGDEFSGKAAGRELSGLAGFLRHIVSSEEDLRTALFCIVDYAGWRVIASSLLPIGSSTLRYGSNNGGVTVLATSPASQVMDRAGQFLNLKPHVCSGSTIVGPADIEVHEGSDGKLYILDTARCSPPEHPARFFQSLLIDCDSKITPVDLPVTGYEEELGSFIPAPHNVNEFLLGSIVSSQLESTLNRLASQLLGADVFGDVLVIPKGIRGRYLYNLLRREFYQSWKTPLSSDAFSGFGRHDARIHNSEIIGASMSLKSALVPRVVELLDHIAQQPGAAETLTGLEITRIMHERGVNMRLLGLVWARSQSPLVKGIVMAEMISRASKQLFRGAMRSAETQKQLRHIVINTLNLLLGESQASVSFYDTAMQLQLRSKYGSYGEVFEAGQDYRRAFDATVLFQRLIFVLGITFSELETDRDSLLSRFQGPRPFSLDMAFEIGQRVKSLVTDGDLRDLAAAAPMCSSSELEQFRRTLGPHADGELASLQRLVRVQIARLILRDFATKKKNALPKVVHIARTRLRHARTLLIEALAPSEPLPIDLISAACHLLVEVNAFLENLSPYQVVAPLEALIAGCPNLASHAYLLFFAFEKLVRAYHALELYEEADRVAARMQTLELCFVKANIDDKLAIVHIVALTRRQCFALFGDDQIVSLRVMGHVFGFLESELSPALEQRLLPFDMALLPVFSCEKVVPPVIDHNVSQKNSSVQGFPPAQLFDGSGQILPFELEYAGPADDFPVECSGRFLDSSKRIFGGGEVSASVTRTGDQPPRFLVTFDPAACRDLSALSTQLEVNMVVKRAKPKQLRCQRDTAGWREKVDCRFCVTCWPEEEKRDDNPLCPNCVVSCHAGHVFSEKEESSRCSCQIEVPSTEKCEKLAANMICDTCDEKGDGPRNPICVGCAAKCHVGHTTRIDLDSDGISICKCRSLSDEVSPADPKDDEVADFLEDMLSDKLPPKQCQLENSSGDSLPCLLHEKPLELSPDLTDLIFRLQVPLGPPKSESEMCTISMSTSQPLVTPIIMQIGGGGRVIDWAVSSSRAIVIDSMSRLSEVVTNLTFPSPSQTKPMRTAGGAFSSVSVGETSDGAFFVALNSKGMPFAWGCGSRGQLGHGDKRDYDAPKVIQALTSLVGIRGICTGPDYCLAFTTDSLFFWGHFKSNVAPFPVGLELPPRTSIIKVAANHLGLPSACVVLFSDHSVYLLEEDKAAPARPPKLVLVEELKDVQVVDVAAADEFVLAVGWDGSVYEFGTRKTEPRLLLSVHGQMVHDEESFKLVANPSADDDKPKVALTPGLDMHLSHSSQLKLAFYEKISRVWAAGKEALLLSQQGQLFHLITGGPAKSIPGRYSDVHSLNKLSIIAVCASPSAVAVPVKPLWEVDARPPVTERFSLCRVPSVFDEGGETFGLKQRDFSVHLADEVIRCKWTRPSWATFFEVTVSVLILGDTDNSYPRNKKAEYTGIVDTSLNVPERGDRGYATDGTERRVRLSLCDKHDACTATASGYLGIPQSLTRCVTCAMDDICAVCVRLCHVGHDLTSAKLVSGFCACGTQSHLGCPRRLSIVTLRPDARKDTVLDSFCMRPVLLKDLLDEMVVVPFRRVLISRVDQLLHVHTRIRQFSYKYERSRIELHPDGEGQFVAQSDQVDEEKVTSLNISHVTPGLYKLVLQKENHGTFDFGLVEFIAPAADRDYEGENCYHAVDEATLPLLSHARWLAGVALKAKYAPTCKVSSVLVDRSMNVTILAEVDLGGVLPENIRGPRLVVARASQPPYCKSHDAALLFKFDIPEQVLGSLKHTIKFSAKNLKSQEGVVVHLTVDMERGLQLVCPIASVDVSEQLAAAILDASTSMSSMPSTNEWSAGPTRPANPVEGQFFFDTSLLAPVWFDGNHWITVQCHPVPK